MQRYISVDAVMSTFSEEQKVQIYGLAGIMAEKGALPLKAGYQLEDIWNSLKFNENQKIVANRIIENAAEHYQLKQKSM